MNNNTKDFNSYKSVVVSSKGQVVSPSAPRKQLSFTPGTQLIVRSGPGGKELLLVRFR